MLNLNFKIYLWSSSKAMAERKKWGVDRNTKIWISRKQKGRCRWNKKQAFFISISGISFGEKKEK